MGKSIPSCDMVAICLLLADFDLDTTMLEVIDREARYEERSDCLFGVSEGDFARAFYLLAIEFGLGLSCEDVLAGIEGMMRCTALREWIPRVLSFNDHGTKDTESYWTHDEEFAGSEWDYRVYNRPFREFFADPARLARADVVAFLGSEAIGDRPLKQHFAFRRG